MELSNQFLDLNNYEKGDMIDQGTFGKVYKISLKNDPNKIYAAKISKSEIDSEDKTVVVNFTREINLLFQISHPSILRFIGFSPIDFKGSKKPVVVTEYSSKGSLKKVIESKLEGWNDTKLLINLYGIASAMQFLHSYGIMHRDLKPGNILLDDDLYPKIADFGLSKVMSNKPIDTLSDHSVATDKGTPIYMAPEIFTETKYTLSGDVYAFSIIVYQLMAKKPCLTENFENYFHYQMKVSQNYRPSFDFDIPEVFKNLIEKCWDQDYERRPSFDEIAEDLKTNPEFLIESVDKKEFFDYVKRIDNDDAIYNKSKRIFYSNYYLKDKKSNSDNSDNNDNIEDNESSIPLDDKNDQDVEGEEKCDDKIDEKELKTREKESKDKEESDEKIDEKELKTREKDNNEMNDSSHAFKDSQTAPQPNQFLDLNNYEKGDMLGQGTFGKVYKISLKNDPNKIYAAKISKSEIDSEDKTVVVNFTREINLLFQISHPSILRFIGFSPIDFKGSKKPVVVTEYSSKGSLKKVIESKLEGWNDTKLLINLYGIASAMQFLHSYGIMHRDLKPGNILLDDDLYPKIADFGLSKVMSNKPIDTLSDHSVATDKGTPIYMAPEIFTETKYTLSGDVYAFSIIVYQLMAKKPYMPKEKNKYQIYKKVANNIRPSFDFDIPEVFKNLIEKCWDQDYERRPSFDEIAEDLKTNPEFLIESVDKKEFFDYVKRIDNDDAIYNKSKRIFYSNYYLKDKKSNSDNSDNSDDDDDESNIPLNDKIRIKDKIEERKVTISKENDSSDIFTNSNEKIPSSRSVYNCKRERKVSNTILQKSQNKSRRKTFSYKNSAGFYPTAEMHKLSNECKNLVEAAEDDPSLQYQVGRSLIEGTNGFPFMPNIGMKYIEVSNDNEYIESILYYCELLMKGKIIPKNTPKAKKTLSRYLKNGNALYLYSMILIEEKDYTEGINYLKQSADEANNEAMYELGKIYLIGHGGNKNFQKAIEYFDLASNNGNEKGAKFLDFYMQLKENKGFTNFPSEVQEEIITHFIESEENESHLNKIDFQPEIIDLMITLKCLDSSDLIYFLSYFDDISFIIVYPSINFHRAFSIVSRIKKNNYKTIKLEITVQTPKTVEHIIGHNSVVDSIILTPSVKQISANSFIGCPSLKQVEFQTKSVFSIGHHAFYGCSSLKHIEIPKTVKTIGKSSFSKCSSITEIKLPPLITSISESLFFECFLLKEIKIPSSVTEIHDSAFFGCIELEKIDIPSSVNSIGNNCFDGCSSLIEIPIPSNCKFIGKAAFSGCSSLKEIQIPSLITHFNEGLFAGCRSLKAITIPPSEKSIEEAVFYGCSSLEKIEIPQSVELIKEAAFYGCGKLESIVIPNSVSVIGVSAFDGCSKLNELVVPDSVKIIGSYAFNGCKNLKKFIIPSTVKIIGIGAFCSCSSLEELIVPPSLVDKGEILGLDSKTKVRSE